MNEIRRPIREADEIDRIRSVVERHSFPEFVTGFDIQLETIDDEPAISILFHAVGPRPNTIEARKARADTLNKLVESVRHDLLEKVGGRYPYFQFDNPEQRFRTLSDPT